MLVQRRDPSLRAYFVWGRYLGEDDEAKAREATQKFMAPNSVYFWMPVPQISRQLAEVLRLASGLIPYDVYLLYRRGILWESTVPAPTYWQQQMGVVQGDTFDITRLETQIQRLLTQ
jgi:hypothetical protein